MTKNTLGLALAVSFCVFCIEGCKCCTPRNNCAPVAPLPPTAVNPYVQQQQENLTPVVPAQPQPIPQTNVAPSPIFPETRRYEQAPSAAILPQWRAPADDRMQFIVPERSTRQPQREGAQLQRPDLSQAGATTTEQASPQLPLIPHFAHAKDRIDSGFRPLSSLEPTADWLKNNRYQFVLHLRQPGEDDSVDRGVVSARGLKYQSLEVSPETLSANIEEFNKIVGDAANLPLFVYDKDGWLAGALWYLHFRTAEKLSHDQALTPAKQLGYREDRSDENVRMLAAIQKYLAQPTQP